MNELLKILAGIFAQHRIPYMVVGGQAVMEYAGPRFTKDIDVTVGMTVENVTHIIDALQEYFKPLPSDPQDFAVHSWVLPFKHITSDIRIDVTFGETLFEQEAIRESRTVRISNVPVQFIAPEYLVVEKIFSGRPQDLIDARNILNAQSTLNRDWVTARLQQFDQELAQDDFMKIWKSILSELDITGEP